MKTVFKNVMFFVVFTSLLFSKVGGSDEDLPLFESIYPNGAQMLDSIIGSSDNDVLQIIAIKMPTAKLIDAFYENNHHRRLAALDVAAYLEDPWPALPYLIAFMEAPQRQAASKAANSVLIIFNQMMHKLNAAPELFDEQWKQTIDMLYNVALNKLISEDIRATALMTIFTIGNITGQKLAPHKELFKDDSFFVRAQTVSLLSSPLSKQELTILAKVAINDKNQIIAGLAVGQICENALSHKMKSPSVDLKKLMISILDKKGDIQSLIPMMSCIVRFSQEARAELVDKISEHSDPQVMEVWKSLQN